MKTRTTSCLVLSLLFVGTAQGQSPQSYGKWEGNGNATIKLYVAPPPLGNDLSATPQNPATPLATITTAINRAGPYLVSSTPVTINVGAGTYSPASGETFPLNVNARNLAIEAYSGYGTGPVVLDSLTNAGVSARGTVMNVSLNPPGEVELPYVDSEVRGLTFLLNNFWTGVQISAIDGDRDTQVLVEACTFTSMQPTGNSVTGLDIFTDLDGSGTATHRILHNTFGAVGPVGAGVGIRENLVGGSSSVCYRSNSICKYETGMDLLNSAPASPSMRPRVQSNTIQIGESLVESVGCDAIFANNTIAYAVRFTAAPPMFGMVIVGGSVALHNNCIWNPDYLGTDATDVLVLGAAIDAQFNNTFDDTFGAVNGNISVNPRFVGFSEGTHPGIGCQNLHLISVGSRRSPLIDAGLPALVDPIGTIPMDGRNLRTDVAVDIDLDPRIRALAGVAAGIDIGADQVNPSRVSPAVGGTQIDAIGNLMPTSGSSTTPPLTYQTNITLSGAPSSPWAMQLAFGFFEALPGAVENSEVFQQSLAYGSLNVGSFHFGVGAGESIYFTSGTLGTSGTQTITIPLGTWWGNLSNEAELHVQALMLDPATSRWSATNRQRIELNW